MKYDHKQIEKKWQKIWEKEGIYRAEFPSKKKKYYVLIEFPYPSGERLHVGHARSYSAMDAIARKRRMQGYNVLYPIGWDAFGLPAENYAIKTGIHPSITTAENIKNAKAQAKSWGLSFDWSREINTTDPKYYKWTQWIFLKLFKKGLAYRDEIPVNWCPSCKTNLANEEIIDGKCERCGAQTGRRMQKQWMLKITKYADKLLKGLEEVDYRDDIKRQQVNWIGRKKGTVVEFSIFNSQFSIPVFTTRLDTIFGVTALVVAPDKLIGNKHLALEIASKEQYQKVKEYIESTQKKSELERTDLKEKTGVFTGAYAINSVNGEKIAIWVADYVLGWYGEGAVMLVPAHDKRDFEFAEKYNIDIKKVVADLGRPKAQQDLGELSRAAGPLQKASASGAGKNDKAFVDKGVLINSGKYSGLTSEKARKKILEDGKKAGWADAKTTYRLRDWVFSRQHYWGEPIPMVYCLACAKKDINWFTIGNSDINYRIMENKGVVKSSQKGNSRDEKIKKDVKNNISRYRKTRAGFDNWDSAGWFPVAEKELPIKLPFIKRYEPTDTGESPLATISKWVKVECPNCGGEARRETDTMPNWAGSSWYYLAYSFWNKQEIPNSKFQIPKEKNMSVFTKYKDQLDYFMPVDWYNGGLEHTTLHLLYSRFWHKFLFDLGVVPTSEPYAKRTSHGVVLGPDGAKMSKSKGNIINPEAIVERFGADAFRVYEMFIGPFDEMVAWNDNALAGARRFLDRVWRLYQEFSMTNFSSKQNSPPPLRRTARLNTSSISGSDNLQLPRNNSNGGGPSALRLRLEELASDIVSPEKLSSSNSQYEANNEDRLKRKLHYTIKKVTEDMEELKFNTAIAAMMEFVNEVYRTKVEGRKLKIDEEDRESSVDNLFSTFDSQNQPSIFYYLSSKDAGVFLRLLAPFAPHLAEELYERIKNQELGIKNRKFESVHLQPWPEYDPALVEEETIEFVVQVNGKVRSKLKVQSSKCKVKEKVEKLARESGKVRRFLEGKKIKKTIFIPGKLINFVVI